MAKKSLKILTTDDLIKINKPTTLNNVQIGSNTKSAKHNKSKPIDFSYLNHLAYFVNLTKLTITHNHLLEIPIQISYLYKLQVIILKNNNIKNINLSILSNLPRLQTLYLSKNIIEEFPNELFKIENLNLFANKIRKISNKTLLNHKLIAKEIPLRNLNLSDNYLKKIPINFDVFNNITKLDISRNNIKNLPLTFANLKNLKELILDKNGIDIIPLAIYQLISLEFLSLAHNKIIFVSEKISQLTNLKTLILRRNQLISLPSGIKYLCNLEVLRIDDNPNLNILPESLIEITSLKKIVIKNTPLKHITPDLEILILYYNNFIN